MFLSHSDKSLKLYQVILTLSICLKALGCSHAIVWLDICVKKQLNECKQQREERVYAVSEDKGYI